MIPWVAIWSALEFEEYTFNWSENYFIQSGQIVLKAVWGTVTYIGGIASWFFSLFIFFDPDKFQKKEL